MKTFRNQIDTVHYVLGGLFILMTGLGVYLWVTRSNLEDQHTALTEKLLSTETRLASTTDYAQSLITELASTTYTLEASEKKGKRLNSDLEDEKDRNDDFEDQIEDITGTIGQLDKLAKIDPELLQKYSKVFFLNEHYRPERPKAIDDEYLYREDEPEFLDKKVLPFFEDMVEEAQGDDVNLWVISAFRSFDEQAQLKGQYLVTYGSGANTFSADQGYSEHQLGTTIDFTTNDLGGGLQGFENTEAFSWLEKNAHKYGFTLSYPENNVYYQFEPWHWRFVGHDLARDLFKDKEYFYDLDQRDIDEYLISFFD